MSAGQLTREGAIVWLNDRCGRLVTLRLVVDGVRQREAPGPLLNMGDGTYQVGHGTLDVSTPDAYAYELRYDNPECDCLAVVLGGIEQQVRSWDRPPRVWNLEQIAAEMRSREEAGGDDA